MIEMGVLPVFFAAATVAAVGVLVAACLRAVDKEEEWSRGTS